MVRLTYVPRPPLSDRVDLFWAFDAYGGPHARERVLPTATSELVVALSDDCLHPVICGAHSESFVIDVASRPALIGVYFKPGTAVPFLKMPANELCNTRVSLDALWGGAAPELRDRLLEARTWPARFRILERALLAQLTGPTRRHPAVAFALSAIQAVPHARTIGQLTERIGLSSRRFIEVFSAEVGLTPKLFCRVHRFQRVLAMIERNEDIDWTDVALACGYDWHDERAIEILKACRRAMRAEATLLLIEGVYPPRIDQSMASQGAAANDVNMLVCTGGRQRSEPEFRALYEAAGFMLTRLIPTPPLQTRVIEGVPR